MIDCIQENGDKSKIILYNGIQKNNLEEAMETNHTEEILLGAFNEVPDPRASYNQKHRFLDILTITILATICGADTWDEIEDWGNTNLEWLKSFLVLENGIPSHDTFNRVFQMIDPKKLHEAFQTWVNGIITKLEGVVAIDGKTIRRSKEEISQTKPAHIVKLFNISPGSYSSASIPCCTIPDKLICLLCGIPSYLSFQAPSQFGVLRQFEVWGNAYAGS